MTGLVNVYGRTKAWNERCACDWFPVGESLVDASQQDSCDVNFILGRYQETGVVPVTVNSGKGVFADVTDLQVDLTEAIMRSDDVLSKAEEATSNGISKRQAAADAAKEASDQAKVDAAVKAALERSGKVATPSEG